jgi:hypothetical protein
MGDLRDSKEIRKGKMVVIPCPNCGSWNTSPLDKKKEFWVCSNPTCMSIPFAMKKHYAIVIENGEWRRVDKDHPFKK